MDSEEAIKEKIRTKRIFRSLLDWLFALLIALVFVFILTHFIVQGKISGESMTDTYQDGQRVLINKHPRGYDVGDVITFWDDKNSLDTNEMTNTSFIQNMLYGSKGREDQELHIKRIVAIPGDTVKVKNNDVYVNGEKRVDASAPGPGIASAPDATYELGTDQYFVVGDNYDNSLDSRFEGPVNVNDILGKVLFSKDRDPRPEQESTNIKYVDKAKEEENK